MDHTLLYTNKTDPWSSHSYIIRIIQKYQSGIRILDVGTAGGTIGRACIGKEFILHGIESEVKWAVHAQPFYEELLISTIEKAPDEFISNHDIVICADILEHLVDPQFTLQRIVSLQNFQTLYIISVPNVANIWIRLNLLFGNFSYTDRGILDRTHLRFFTKKTFWHMLTSSGLKVESLYTTPIPLNLVHPWFEKNVVGRTMHGFLMFLTHLWPTLFGYQFVVTARSIHE